MAKLTLLTLAELVARDLPGRSEFQWPSRIDDIEAFVSRACNKLAVTLTKDPIARNYISKSYPLLLSSGVADLSGFPDMLYESLPTAHLTHDDSDYPLVYVRNHKLLYYPMADQYGPSQSQPDGQYIYWSLHDQTIVTRNVDGERDTLTGTITADEVVFVPVVDYDDNTATTVHEQLNDMLVEILVDIAMKGGKDSGR